MTTGSDVLRRLAWSRQQAVCGACACPETWRPRFSILIHTSHGHLCPSFVFLSLRLLLLLLLLRCNNYKLTVPSRSILLRSSSASFGLSPSSQTDAAPPLPLSSKLQREIFAAILLGRTSLVNCVCLNSFSTKRPKAR